MNTKKREKKERQVRRVTKRKGMEAQRVKDPTPSRAVDELIEEEEQKGKQKITKRKSQGAGPKPRYPGPFGHLLCPVWIRRWAYSDTWGISVPDLRVS